MQSTQIVIDNPFLNFIQDLLELFGFLQAL
jgi:hypothetical protein